MVIRRRRDEEDEGGNINGTGYVLTTPDAGTRWYVNTSPSAIANGYFTFAGADPLDIDTAAVSGEAIAISGGQILVGT